MSKLVLTTAPTDTPVTLTEVKTYLKWDDASGSEVVDADDRLAELIDEATELAEVELGGKLCSQTWTAYYDRFEDSFRLPLGPVASITSVKYTDTGGTLQTVASTVYELGDDHGVGVVRLQYGETWPTALDHPDSVAIAFVCGYGDEDDVPRATRIAILEIIANLARRIPGEAQAIPKIAQNLLSTVSYRTIS